MMKALCTLLVLALSAPVLAKEIEEPKDYLRKALRAEVLVVAEVVEVHASPGTWSGESAALQYVRYRPVNVLLGSIPGEQFEVGHVVVQGSPTADPVEPRLLPSLFKPGNRLILLLTEGKCVENMTGHGPESGLPVFCAGDVQFGAVPADAEYLAKARNALTPVPSPASPSPSPGEGRHQPAQQQ